LTPLLRHRLKELFPRLQDDDLPRFEVAEDELVSRITRRTGRSARAVRQVLYELGVLVRPRVAVNELHTSRRSEESLGSGIPEDTGPSGTMGLGPGW
jgi:hypothetical protein